MLQSTVRFRISFVGYISKNRGLEIGFAGSGIEYTRRRDGRKDYEIDLQTTARTSHTGS